MEKAIAHHQLTDAQPVPPRQHPLPKSPRVSLLTTSSYAREYPLGQLSWLCPSQPLVHPSLPAVGAERGTEKALMLCKQCSASAKTSLCYQHRPDHKSKP